MERSKFAELVMLGIPKPEDYSTLGSRALLNEGAILDQALGYAQAALEYQISLLAKEWMTSGRSEASLQIAEVINGVLVDCQRLARKVASIQSEAVRRIWKNAVNGYFMQLRLGLLRNDPKAQVKAMQNLYRLFGGIPAKKDWFHPEGWDGNNSLTNVLVAKELNRHKSLDLPTTLEHAMDGKFRYLYRAYECDFKDEIDKYERRAFETELTDQQVSISDEELSRTQLVRSLEEAAIEQKNDVDKRIILVTAGAMADGVLLNRADLVNRVSRDTGVTKQWVRRRLEGGVQSTMRGVLCPPRGLKLILTEDNEKK